MNKDLNAFLKKNKKFTSIAYVLYATLATYFACKYIAIMGYPIGDTLATVAAVMFVPIVFKIAMVRKTLTKEFEDEKKAA